MNAGRISITFEALGRALGLPEGREVVAVVPADDRDIICRQVRLVISGPDLPAVQEGWPIPEVALPPKETP